MTTTYAYRAIDKAGQMQEGTLVGDDTDSVADRVRRMGLRPVAVTPKRGQFATRDFTLPGFGGKKADTLALFSRQFSTMTASGTPILKCLTVLENQADDDSFRDALRSVRSDIENGDQLSEAIERQPSWFDEFFVAMIRSGEGSGSLPLVLERLAEATESIARIRRKVRSALAYPVAVGCLIVLCVLAMLMFLIPTFAGIFRDLKGTLPLPTRMVMGVSGILTHQFPIVLAVVVAAAWWFRRWKKQPAGRLKWDTWKLRIPVFGQLNSQTSLARFSRSLSVLVTTGVPAVEALGIAKSTASNCRIAQSVDEVARSVNGGGRMSTAMSKQACFTEMVVQMVAVGEESGALDEMLDKVAEVYEAEVNATVESLTALLEPLLIVAMGVTVGGILLSVYLPMFQAISLVK